MADSPKTGNQEFGDLLREAREDRGMSRRDLADATNLSYPYISQLETGYRMPSPAAIQTLSRVLGVSLDAIFAAITGPAEPPAPEPRFGARATPAGWVQNPSYDSSRGGAQVAGGAAPPSAAGDAAGAAVSSVAESFREPPAPLLLGAPAPATAAPSGQTGMSSAPATTMVGSVSAAVDVLLRLSPDLRLAALAEVQSQIVDSVVAERVEQGRHP